MANNRIGHCKLIAPAAENSAETFQKAAEQIMDGDPLFRKELFRSVFVHDPWREDCDIRVGFHVADHPAEEGRIECYVRIHDQVVFALQQRKHRVVGSAEPDIPLLRKNCDAGEEPFHFFGGQILGRVVGQIHIHFQIGILNTPQGVGQLIPAVIEHDTGGKDRSHQGNLRRHNSHITDYFTDIKLICP